MRNVTFCLSFDPAQSYRDILSAIGDIQTFTQGMDFEAFRETPMAVAAVERKLQIISEAAIRLRSQPLPDEPWRNIRGMGNWMRHQYDRIDLDMVWSTVQDDLEPLKSTVLHNLAAFIPPPPKPPQCKP